MNISRFDHENYTDFELLSSEDLALFRQAKYYTSELIYAQNIKFIILKSGQAKLSYINGTNEFIINFINKGSIVLIDSDSVLEFLSDSEAMELNLCDVKELFENEKFSMAMVNSLIRTTIMTRQIVADIVFGSLESRIVSFLHNLADEQHMMVRDKKLVEIPFSIATLSNLLGAQRQSVSTIFNKLIKTGKLIKYGKSSYIIA
ncbi:Crp/Fnr family transcriptional regulator [Campylobacter sp. CLAX-22107-21]|uniref:Crp/Fnr family transcriptional regulator n=1 Tax=Campylobacter devanensis TaxID=3161138 RepID=UPI000A34D8EC|nr:Crp/Fnr family transcriptional regulator [Campylobacter sp. P0087]MEE3694112.1 Crp/Fnr family transcriptional regulator [Campylobacter sp. CLAX-22107-21]